MTTQHEKIQENKIKAALWKRGELSFLLDKTQHEMKSAFEASAGRSFIWLCSRRLGKSYALSALAMETAYKKKTKIIYATASYKAAKEIIRPLMGKLLESCPTAIRPQFKTQDSKYVFPNGSELLLIGLDKDPDSPRGQEADLVILDEAGFINKLDYLIGSVFTPMLLMTNGRILMATTPPKEEDHPFLSYLEKAETTGALITRTIYDCPRITPDLIKEYMDEAGGEASENWQREYLCKIIRSQENTVIPEFDDKAQADIVTQVSNPPHMDRYVAMDLGFVDFTGVLFGYYDFLTGKIKVQDELVINRDNTANIAKALKSKEKALWPDIDPYKRIGDCNNPQFIYDLASLHGYSVGADPRVGTKEQRVNRLRLMVQRREIEIDPKCKNLIAQLKYARWKKGDRLTYERSEAHGHYDLVDAMVILVNSIDKHNNPIPVNYNIHVQSHTYRPPSEANELQKIVNPAFRKFRRPY